MFFARFLFFSLAMFFSHLQADEVRKQPLFDDDHTIKIHSTATPQKNISRLASLQLAGKEKKSATNTSTNLDPSNKLNLDTDNHCHDDAIDGIVDDTKRTLYRFIIHSPHLDQLKKIAADFKKNITANLKEKMHRLKDLIRDDDEHEPMLLPIGVDNHSIKNQLPEDENLLPQNHAMLEIASAAGIAATTGSSAASATFTAALANAAAATTTAVTTIATPVIAATTATTVTTVVAAPVAVATNAGVCASIGSGITWIGTTIGAIATAPATIAAAAGLSAGALVLYLFGESPSATKARHAAEKLAAQEAIQATARANSLKEAAEKVTRERIAREKLLQQAAEQEKLKALEIERIRLANEAAEQAKKEAKTLRDAIETEDTETVTNIKPTLLLLRSSKKTKTNTTTTTYRNAMCNQITNEFANATQGLNNQFDYQVFNEQSHYKVLDTEFNKKHGHLAIDAQSIAEFTPIVLGAVFPCIVECGIIGVVAPYIPVAAGLVYTGVMLARIIKKARCENRRDKKDKKDAKDQKKKNKPDDPKDPEKKNSSKELEKLANDKKSKEIPTWDNKKAIDFLKELKNNGKQAQSPFSSLHQDPKTGLWWSKDVSKHGGPHYKVFQETVKGLVHKFNADALGNEIINQHKGATGSFISWKDIRFKP